MARGGQAIGGESVDFGFWDIAAEGVFELIEFIALEEGVGFVDDEGGLGFLDDAEEGGRTDVGGDHGTVDEFAEEGKEGGLAAPFFGRLDADIGADIANVEGVGVENLTGSGARAGSGTPISARV